MPSTLDRDRVTELVSHGAQLVEVLPREEYEEEHLPEAIHLPLKGLSPESAAVLDRARPVVVYCWDALCDMSPRAAWRLERLGFATYDYAAGKVDWLAAGMPSVRADESERRALDGADRDPPTCPPDAPVAALDTPVLVVNTERIVLGRIRAGEHPSRARAEDVMDSGPATVRAHEPLEPLLERMERRHVHEIVVTTPEGQLLGVVRRP
jgi:rhodanese-related sulfurtransferase